MKERRQHRRERAGGAVDYEGSVNLRCEEVFDLSVSGIRLLLSGAEKTGREVRLTVRAADGAPAVMRGLVVWARQASPFQVGIRFLDAGNSFVDALKAG